ncbi:cytosolic Fe-S cluster assembly factor narfl-like [Hibiscus syriacus]|uniref:Cytosolic Fe-S cluster assembly factor narfl-like n=1 Tax=Hibiscus syriacus TaxID=106335 RepID=A0A6A2YQT4_HIBSY|nr:cytosolic Fe-S cluster assembly factor narfl-like [Hibiscus syriacus]
MALGMVGAEVFPIGRIDGGFILRSSGFYSYVWSLFSLLAGEVARIGAGVFLLLQLVSVIEFIRWWNKYWAPDEQSKKSICSIALFTSTVFYVASICGIVSMYYFYAPKESCSLNIFFITWTFILVIVMMAMSMHSKVNRGLLSSGIMAAYVVFLCWSAVRSEYELNNIEPSIKVVGVDKALASGAGDCEPESHREQYHNPHSRGLFDRPSVSVEPRFSRPSAAWEHGIHPQPSNKRYSSIRTQNSEREGRQYSRSYVLELVSYASVSLKQKDVKELRDFWDSWKSDRKQKFSQRYGDIVFLLHVKTDEPLIRALVQLWNSGYNCFTFNQEDMVPTIEEYTTLMHCESIRMERAYIKHIKSQSFKNLLAKVIEVGEKWVTDQARCKGNGEGNARLNIK